MAKALSLLNLSLLLASCFTVFAQDLDTVSFAALPPHYHSVTPAVAPSPHHHHSHPPTASPAHAPTHHKHHGHPPAHAPVHTPSHAPAHTPTHAPVHPPHIAPTHPPHTPPAHPPHIAPTRPPHTPPAHPPSYHFPRSFVEVQGVIYCKSCKYAGADTLLGATPVLNATVKLQCNNTKYPTTVQQQTDKNGYFLLRAPKTVTNYGAHKCKVFLVSSPLASCQKPSNLHGGATGAVLRPEKLKSEKPPVVLFTAGPLAFEPKCPH